MSHEHHHEKPKEDAYYVGVPDSVALRRTILETARSVVQTVSVQSKIRELQEEKLRLRTELAHSIRHIREGLQKLQTALPQPHTPLPDMPAAPHVSLKKRVVTDHRLDKIESALNEIELRMRSL